MTTDWIIRTLTFPLMYLIFMHFGAKNYYFTGPKNPIV